MLRPLQTDGHPDKKASFAKIQQHSPKLEYISHYFSRNNFGHSSDSDSNDDKNEMVTASRQGAKTQRRQKSVGCALHTLRGWKLFFNRKPPYWYWM
jgi:hypothetical protein